MIKHTQTQKEYEQALCAQLMAEAAKAEGRLALETNEALQSDPGAAVPEEVDRRCREILRSGPMGQRSRRDGRTRQFLPKAILAAALCVLMLLTAASAGFWRLSYVEEQNEGIADEYQMGDLYLTESGTLENGTEYWVYGKQEYGLQFSGLLANGVEYWDVSLTPEQQARRAREDEGWYGEVAVPSVDSSLWDFIYDDETQIYKGMTGFDGTVLTQALDGEPGQYVTIEIVDLPDEIYSVCFGISYDGQTADSLLYKRAGDMEVLKLPDYTDSYTIMVNTWDTGLAFGESGTCAFRIAITDENPIAE